MSESKVLYVKDDAPGHRPGCGCAEGDRLRDQAELARLREEINKASSMPIIVVPEEFPELIRRNGRQHADIVRLEELLASTRAQAEHHLAERLKVEAILHDYHATPWAQAATERAALKDLVAQLTAKVEDLSGTLEAVYAQMRHQ